jgi:hypothetical protein
VNWLRKQLARLRDWACEDTTEVTVDRADSIGVTLVPSKAGPRRVAVWVTAADGTVRAVTLTPLQADLLSRQLRAAVLAGIPLTR